MIPDTPCHRTRIAARNVTGRRPAETGWCRLTLALAAPPAELHGSCARERGRRTTGVPPAHVLLLLHTPSSLPHPLVQRSTHAHETGACSCEARLTPPRLVACSVHHILLARK